MKISKTLEEAVKNHDLTGIYSVFYTILHEDPGFFTGKFDQTLDYVKSRNIPGLMKQYNGEPFEPQDKWDEEYWAIAASELVDNFCEERILHLKEIGRKLYPARKMTDAAKRSSNDRQTEQRVRKNRRLYHDIKK